MSAEILQLLGALRRIAQSLDTHSKMIEHSAGLTLPQLLLLEALRSADAPPSAGRLAQQVSLTQGTVTSILDRLEARQLVRRVRSDEDRRQVLVVLTARGAALLKRAPPPMHAEFIRGFKVLPAAERRALLAAIDRTADLMRAAAPPAVTPAVSETV